MFVRKFEGESLDEALQAVKRELGPDAIILKTVTNKGLKGAMNKRGKIEITAAISEQNYTEKAKVDNVLSDEQQDAFYRTPANKIKKKISNYNMNKPQAAEQTGRGYGAIGLNKVVNSVTKASAKIQSSLDDFLSVPEETNEINAIPAHSERSMDEFLNGSSEDEVNTEEMPIENFAQQLATETSRANAEENYESQRALNSANANNEVLGEQLKSQSYQIELLEQKLYELTQKVSAAPKGHEEQRSITGLRNSLKSLELKDKIIVDILKKASFEMTKEDLEDTDMIYDFALREINGLLSVEMPLFSKSEMGDKQVVTILVSEGASGQASMATKLGVLQENVKIIQFRANEREVSQNDFTRKMFNLDVACVSTLSHLMSEARKAISEGQSLIIDLKLNFQAADETKKFLEILRRSFENVEILTTISAINSEVYNRKVLTKYNPFTNGVIISYIDQCLNFGALVNLNTEFDSAPMKFFGTGPTVPDDIEAATSERILAAMFQL